MQSQFVLCRICFGHLPLHPFLGWYVGSSSLDRLIGSTCAEDNCDSNVPSYDRYNTQLRVGPIALFLPFLFVPLWGMYPPRGIVARFISSLPVTHLHVLPAEVSMAFGSWNCLMGVHPLGLADVNPP